MAGEANDRTGVRIVRAGGTRRWKRERKINQSLFAQINFAEVNARRDFADLVTNPMRNQRGLGVVQNDALFVIHPALAFVHLGDDSVESKRQDLVSQGSLRWI